MAYAQTGHVGICFQQSFGTPYTASMDFFGFINETITENIEDLLSESIQTRYEEPDPYEGMHRVEGDLVTEVHPILIGKLLMAAVGQESVYYTGSCYSHLMLPVNSDWSPEISALPPMTIEIYRATGSAYQYSDMLLNRLALDISQGTIYRATASFIGANFAWAQKQSPSYYTGSLYTWDTVSLQLGGAAISNFSEISIAINNNLEGFAYLDMSKTYGRILRNDYRIVEVSGTMLLVGDTEARNYRARTGQAFRVAATHPETIMDGHNQLDIDIPKMRYTEFPANLPGPGIIPISFSAKGGYEPDSSYAIQYTVTNTKEAYV